MVHRENTIKHIKVSLNSDICIKIAVLLVASLPQSLPSYQARALTHLMGIGHQELLASGTLAQQTSQCGDAQFTKDWFLAKVLADPPDLSYMDLIMYAGYTRRTQILKECMVVDTEV
jgi:hypothetical protein